MSATPTDLFPAAVAPSPHAAWLAEHDLIVRDYQDHHNGGWLRSGLNTARFLCANRAMTRYASGDTEDAAEQAYCLRFDLPWWKLAIWNEAMAAREDCDFKKAHEKDEQIGGWQPAQTEEGMAVG